MNDRFLNRSRNWKRLLTLVLASCLMLSGTPAAVFAEAELSIPDSGSSELLEGAPPESPSSEAPSSEATPGEESSSELFSIGASAPGCTCGAGPDAAGNTLHAEDCPLYEAPAPEEEPPATETSAAELLAALPDPETLEGRAENAPAEEIAAARETLDALSDEERRALDPALIEKLTALEHIRDTLCDCLDPSCRWHYPPEARAALREDETPAPLTLRDLVEDYGVEPPISYYLRSAGGNPATLAHTADNEDNAHTGRPDGDLDLLLNFLDKSSPIELRFELDAVPERSAYLAVKALDVDEEAGEDDHVFVNGEEVGLLSGTNDSWNTTILELPLGLLRKGDNYIEVQPSEDPSIIGPSWGANWVVQVDWMQLILDGGEADPSLEHFSITLGTPLPVSDGTVQVPATVEIKQTGSTQYLTEYSILDEKGQNLDATFGKATAEETVLLSIPARTPNGAYSILGVIKDPDTEIIEATDRAEFMILDGQVIVGPKLTYTLTPDTLTNRDVTVALATEPDARFTDVELWLRGQKIGGTSASFPAPNNGNYTVTVRYQRNGAQESYTKTIPVGNIDKEPPEIVCAALTMPEDTPDAQVGDALAKALTVTDNVTAGIIPAFTLPAGFSAGPGTKAVTVTAADAAGNTATKNCGITILPLPAALTATGATRQGETDSFILAGSLAHTGGLTYSETGFVWGAMPGPTLEVSHGKAATAAPVNEKGGEISVTAKEIAAGLPYYARAYAKYNGGVLYSAPLPFGLDVPSYGTFSVTNNGGNTFTISRAGGSDGAQTVYFRTVNGSAVGGTHFEHQAGALTFANGVTERIVTVTERGVNAAYGGNAATGYSNADRTYQLELYRVKGGATIDQDRRAATRTMTKDRTVNRGVYDWKTTLAEGGTRRVSDDGYGNNPVLSLSAWRDVDATSLAYLRAQGTEYAFYLLTEMHEIDDGYQYIKFTSDEGRWKEAAKFEIKSGKEGTSWRSGCHIPCTGSTGSGGDITNFNWQGDLPLGSIDTNNAFFRFPASTTSITVNFDASGNGNDDWEFRSAYQYGRAEDLREPQVLGLAPMAGGTYLPGDPITVAVVFDEIVDSQNSTLGGVSISTNYGAMTYSGGADTNVLTFTGKVPEGVSGPVTLQSWTGADKIKDMCDTAGTQSSGSGSAGVTADPSKPTVAITSPTSGSLPRHSAAVSASGCATLQYAWMRDANLPVTGWLNTSNGATITTRQADGDWYLHLLATNENGCAASASQRFTFQSPALAVLVSDPDEWKPRKTITVTPSRTAGAVSIAMEGPVSDTFTGEGTKIVFANGDYAFTFTDGYGTVLTERLTVTKIDPVKPTVTLSESGNTGAVYHTLAFSAKAADEGGSKLASVDYQWTNSEATPSGGWQRAAEASGRYSMTYSATEEVKTTKYLHVRATDGAGNVTEAHSKGYTVVAEPGPEAALVLNVTGGDPANWSKDPVALNWSVFGGAGNTAVYLPGNNVSNQASGSVSVTHNGLYTFRAADQNGESVTKSVRIGKIDAEAPVLSGLSASPQGWAKSKTVTLSGVSDDCSPLVDENGNVTGYGGSGVAKREWRLESGNYTVFDADSFTAAENGTYTVRLTDKAGNQNEYTVTAGGIERAAPSVTVSVPAAGWTPEAQSLTVTYADEASGVKSAQYAITDSQTAPAGGLSLLPDSGGSVEVSENGTHYLYHRVEDNAGNVSEGFSAPVKVDAQAPALVVTGGESGAAGLLLTVTSTFGPSGGDVTVQKDGGEVRTVTGDTFTVTQKGVYAFTAASKAGKTAGRTVTVQEITFDPAGGSSVGRQLVVDGGSATAPQTPARAGYTFRKWQADGEDYDFEAPVTAGLTLTALWTLDAPAVVVTATPENAMATYGGGRTAVTLAANPSHAAATPPAYTYQWYRSGVPVEGATGSTLELSTVAESGAYTVEVAAKDGTLTSEAAESDPVTAAIAKATPTVRVTSASAITYGGTLSKSALTGESGGVSGSFFWMNGSLAPAVSDSGKTAYPVTFTPTDGGNYTPASTTARVTVEKKELVPSVATVGNKTYDGKADAIGTLTLDGAVFGEQPAAGGTFAFTSAAAGQNKHVNVTGIALTDNWGDNYALSAEHLDEAATSAEIARKEIGLSWNGFEGLVYTGNPVNVTAAATRLVEGDACTVTVTGGTGTDAGSYTAAAKALGNPNYKLPAETTRDYTIAKAPITFAVTGNVYTYDTAAKAATVAQAAGELSAGDGYTVSYRPKGSPGAQATQTATRAGTYDILVTLTDDNFRHAGEADAATRAHKAGELVIDPKGITATWGDLVHLYDGQPKAPALSLEGIIVGDDCSYQISGGGRADAGVSPIFAGLTGADAPNYRLRNPSATLTIQKAPVAFTVTGGTVLADGRPHTATVAAIPADAPFTVTYRQNGKLVESPTEPGAYEIWVELTNANYRHSGTADGAPRRTGVLTLYREAPPPLYTVAFSGGEGAAGTAPTLPASPAGAVLYLPESPYTKTDHAFTGWTLDGKLYQPGDAFPMSARSVTFTARWEKTVHDVGGMVTQEGEPVEGAVVTLMRGARRIAETATDARGQYRFTGLTPGFYNLVASKSGTVMTIKVEIAASDVGDADITLPLGMTNSVVEVAAGTPPIVVGNLEQTFDGVDGVVYTAGDAATVAAGGAVEIRFTAEEQPLRDAGDAAKIAEKKAGSDQISLLLELTLDKTVTPLGGEATIENLPESSVLLEAMLFLPAELQGKYSYTVYRVHGGEVQTLTEQKNENGEFIELNEARTVLTLHARLFSTYAVAYADRPGSSSSPDGSGDGHGSFFRPGEYDFWEQVQKKILNAKPGDTVKANARGFDRMPEKVMEALRGHGGVSLEITWTGGGVFLIPAGQALEPEGLRVYYPLGYLEEIYNALPPAAGSKTNPETGGIWKVAAPEPAPTADALPATPDNAGLAATPELAQKANEQAEKATIAPAAPTEPDAPAGNPTGNGIVWPVAILLLTVAVGGKAWYRKRRQA